MSVTFTANTNKKSVSVKTVCICAQMSPVFFDVFEGRSDDWDALASDTDPDCFMCKAKGWYMEEQSQDASVNFSNANAILVLKAMGLPPQDESDLWGQLPIAEARRGIIRARNVTNHELRESTAEGRVFSTGMDRAGLMERVDAVSEVIEASAREGGKTISWG